MDSATIARGRKNMGADGGVTNVGGALKTTIAPRQPSMTQIVTTAVLASLALQCGFMMKKGGGLTAGKLASYTS